MPPPGLPCCARRSDHRPRRWSSRKDYSSISIEGEVRALARVGRRSRGRGGHSMVAARSGFTGNSADDAPAHGRTACERADEIRAAQRGRLLRGARLAGRLRAVPAARSRSIQALALALSDVRAFTGARSAESRPGALVRRRRAPAITRAIHARSDLGFSTQD